MAEKQDNPKLCFVVAPIGDEGSAARVHSDWLLEEIVRPVMAAVGGFDVKRGDEFPQPGMIDTQIFEALFNAELVIADLTMLNPNVFYEIGIRHMAQKPIIHMHLKGRDKIPFDVGLYRSTEFCLATPQDLRASRDRLTVVVKAVLAPGYEVENPVTKARGRVKLEENATPEIRVLMDELGALRARLDRLDSPMGGFLGRTVIKLSGGISDEDIQTAIAAVHELVGLKGIFGTRTPGGALIVVPEFMPDNGARAILQKTLSVLPDREIAILRQPPNSLAPSSLLRASDLPKT